MGMTKFKDIIKDIIGIWIFAQIFIVPFIIANFDDEKVISAWTLGVVTILCSVMLVLFML